MAYRMTPHSEAPFYLIYGRDARLPTALDFSILAVVILLATDYAKELCQQSSSKPEKQLRRVLGKHKLSRRSIRILI